MFLTSPEVFFCLISSQCCAENMHKCDGIGVTTFSFHYSFMQIWTNVWWLGQALESSHSSYNYMFKFGIQPALICRLLKKIWFQDYLFWWNDYRHFSLGLHLVLLLKYLKTYIFSVCLFLIHNSSLFLFTHLN